jgi:uncharacterized protein HemX
MIDGLEIQKENQMKIRLIVLSVTVLALTASVQAAGLQQRDRDQKRDGSCQTSTTSAVESKPIRQRAQLRDGSCTTMGDQLRQRDRLRDGSCQAP